MAPLRFDSSAVHRNQQREGTPWNAFEGRESIRSTAGQQTNERRRRWLTAISDHE